MHMQRLLARGGLWLLLIATLGIVALGTIRGESTLRGYLELRHSRELLAQTVAGLKQENEAIGAEIDRIKNSPSYARKVLRDKYHVTDSDENIMFIAE